MDYIELEYHLADNEQNDLLVAALSDIEFESFREEDERFYAYIPSSKYSEKNIRELPLIRENILNGFTFSVNLIEDQNWNAVWESNFQPVILADQCYIRAPFHAENKMMTYEIIIEPKMSFGTAHHETTAMMIERMLKLDIKNKTVLDMGCGTGVLAILAELLGAKEILAVDNDEWAYRNSVENVERNRCQKIEVVQGDASFLKGKMFDIIVANINRNILLSDMESYSGCMRKGSQILFSGFYEKDLEVIREKAVECGLQYKDMISKNQWVAAKYYK